MSPTVISTAIPTFHTTRLTLRPMRPDDFPAYAAMMASARVHFMGGPYDLRAAWGTFCHDMACWALFGHGALMIEDATGATLGQVGINAGPLFPEPELGWFLYDGHEGHGIATEAAACLRDWAFDAGNLPTLVSYTDPHNHASQRVALRLGGRLDPDAPLQDEGDLAYRYAPGTA